MPTPSPNLNQTDTIHIVGRFPPPIDGQSLATLSLADLLQRDFDVRRFNMTLPNRALLPTGLTGTLSTAGHYLRLMPKLKRRLSDGNPVLWTNISSQRLGHWRDLLAILPCLQPNQPIIAVVHWGIFAQLFEDWATRSTIDRLIDRMSGIVVLSKELANQVVDQIPDGKLHIIPNYVQPMASEEEVALKRRLFVTSKVLKVLFLSHMMREKGCYDLLEGIAMANNLGLNIDAHFAGRWNHAKDEELFHRRVHELGLKQSVTVHGPINDRSTVAELHRMAHVFALPSILAEAQPLAIMEALSAATPVVITKRPTLEFLVGSQQGAFLVPRLEPRAIAEALVSLSDKKTWLQSSVAARKRFETAFSPESVRDLWLNLVREL